jgi:hypothetical protein
MDQSLIEFEWWRCLDGYRLDRFGLASVSDRFQEYRPLDTPALFAKFADTQHSAEGMCAFANQYGLLGGGRPDINRTGGKSKDKSVVMDVLLAHHASIRRAVDLFESNASEQLIKRWNEAEQGPTLLRAELRASPDGGMRMVLVPADLIRAMWLQFAGHVCSGTQLFRCVRCNEPFTVGTGTGRRRTALYCSNACKVAAYQARQRGEN